MFLDYCICFYFYPFFVGLKSVETHCVSGIENYILDFKSLCKATKNLAYYNLLLVILKERLHVFSNILSRLAKNSLLLQFTRPGVLAAGFFNLKDGVFKIRSYDFFAAEG